jgi:hypothetical protein
MGGGLITLSVLPHDRGAAIRLSTEGTVLRERKAECKAVWRKDLAAWARVLQDVLEGPLPWCRLPSSARPERKSAPRAGSPEPRRPRQARCSTSSAAKPTGSRAPPAGTAGIRAR